MSRQGVRARWAGFKTGHRFAKSMVGAVTFLVPLIGLLLALGVIRPFGGTEDALASAVDEAREAGSAFIDVRREFRVGGEVGRQYGEGAIEFQSREGILDLRTAGNVGEPELRYVFVGPSVYVFGYVPMKSVWCEYHVQSSGRFFGAIAGFSDDPSQVLENLRDHGNVETDGEEELLGDTTVHYKGSLDLEDLREDSPESIRQRLAPFIKASGSTLPIEVWIGSDDLVRRIETAFELPGAELGLPTEGRVKIRATYELSQYGAEVRAAPPSQQQTFHAGSNGCPPSLQ